MGMNPQTGETNLGVKAVATLAAFEALGTAGKLDAGDIGILPDGAEYKWTGDAVVPHVTTVSGLAGNFVLQGAGTYNSTQIMGYRVVAQGAADWTLDPVGGASIAVVPTAFVVGQVYPEQLESITVGTGGSAILYIP